MGDLSSFHKYGGLSSSLIVLFQIQLHASLLSIYLSGFPSLRFNFLSHDRAQLIFLGLPILLLCSDLFNLFIPPPPKTQNHPPPSISHPQRPAAIVSETLDFASQQSNVAGGIGHGNAVEINFCVSCSYKLMLQGNCSNHEEDVRDGFSGIDVILANYPPPAPKLLATCAAIVPNGSVSVIVKLNQSNVWSSQVFSKLKE
ncbi:unnamed protein product, partial [Thlaspi arvense]